MAGRPEPSTPPRSNDSETQTQDASSDLSTRGTESQDDTSTSPAVSWMLRVRSRNDELKKYFGLPASENLLDEFHCALRWRILLQGRMYVFDSYVCFYSNVFGYLKNKTIPLKDVVAVKKKTHFRFPNSIELECRDGSRYFFTSFLSRDEAYRLIANAWHQCSDNAPDSPDDSNSPPASSSASLTGPSARPALTLDISNLDSGADIPPPPSTRTERRVFFGMNSCRTPATTKSVKVLPHSLSEGSAVLKHASTDFLASEGRDALPSEPDRGLEEEEEDALSDRDSASHEDEDLCWDCAAGPPPPMHKEHKLLFSADLPCTTREFYSRFLANDSHFFEECQEAAGDRRVIVTSWRRDQQLGLLRDLSFVSPIKSAFANWGTSHTQCYQTQRISCYTNGTILLETSQNMTDIPYGDCFSVDMYILITPAGPPAATTPTAKPPAACTTAFNLRVNFTRKCLFRRIIESGTHKQCTDFYSDLVARARAALQAPPAGAASPGAPVPAAAGPSPVPSPSTPPPQGALPAAPQQPGHQRMPSLASLDASLSLKLPPTLDLSGDPAAAAAAPKGLFGLQPTALILLLTTLLLQVVLLAAWLWQAPAAPQAAVVSTPQQWLQRLGALQEESRLLQARMDLVAREAALVMQQLQHQLPSPSSAT